MTYLSLLVLNFRAVATLVVRKQHCNNRMFLNGCFCNGSVRPPGAALSAVSKSDGRRRSVRHLGSRRVALVAPVNTVFSCTSVIFCDLSPARCCVFVSGQMGDGLTFSPSSMYF